MNWENHINTKTMRLNYMKSQNFDKLLNLKPFKQCFIFFIRDFYRRNIIFQKASAALIFLKSAGKANIFSSLFPP